MNGGWERASNRGPRSSAEAERSAELSMHKPQRKQGAGEGNGELRIRGGVLSRTGIMSPLHASSGRVSMSGSMAECVSPSCGAEESMGNVFEGDFSDLLMNPAQGRAAALEAESCAAEEAAASGWRPENRPSQELRGAPRLPTATAWEGERWIPQGEKGAPCSARRGARCASTSTRRR